jgi:hypothetical protein
MTDLEKLRELNISPLSISFEDGKPKEITVMHKDVIKIFAWDNFWQRVEQQQFVGN